MALLSAIAVTPAERAAALPGDGLVPRPDVVMDRAGLRERPRTTRAGG